MKRPSTLVVLLFVAGSLALGACSRGGGPVVRIYDGSVQTGSAAGAASATPQRETGAVPVAVSPNGVHIVRRGQTLYSIARAYNAPLRALIVENGLAPPYRLEIGDRLRVPQAESYRVRPGDTVYGVSRDFGVSMTELVRLNGIAAPYTIRVGQRLLIPGRVSVEPARADAPPTPDAKEVAERTQAALRAPDPEPAPAREAAASRPRPPDPPDALPDRPFRMTDAGDPRPRVKPEPPRRALASIAQPPARAASRFLWPVEGRVVSRFGPKGKGLHNDGLNIAAPRGAAVRAAENGVVAYAGTELKGFGNGVLVKHADGYMTFYAHNDAVLVARGQTISRGQTIARVGSSGNVDQPQLHFQIRRGREALNPERLLGG
ncbi:MAG: LysM peptidoglycan-binding domain-containing M23 family metallopeptidase [Alphaproteobacteria bacterium]|nr:LysM peptidoglycan-binding domain-containing M23 family metallopeptidase [Alphaproteobacteria bacterium]